MKKNPISKVNAIHKKTPGAVDGIVIRRGHPLPDTLPKPVVESYIRQGMTFPVGDANAGSDNKTSKG